jgi:hypothetical protein
MEDWNSFDIIISNPIIWTKYTKRLLAKCLVELTFSPARRRHYTYGSAVSKKLKLTQFLRIKWVESGLKPLLIQDPKLWVQIIDPSIK